MGVAAVDDDIARLKVGNQLFNKVVYGSSNWAAGDLLMLNDNHKKHLTLALIIMIQLLVLLVPLSPWFGLGLVVLVAAAGLYWPDSKKVDSAEPSAELTAFTRMADNVSGATSKMAAGAAPIPNRCCCKPISGIRAK